MTVMERLLAYSEWRDNCLVWTRSLDPKGYGRLQVENHHQLAHRLMWVEHHGPIPDGLSVCHACDNPPCVNIAHLWLGTIADNTADMIAKGRDRHPRHERCSKGHSMADAYVRPDNGHRMCRTCRRERDASR